MVRQHRIAQRLRCHEHHVESIICPWRPHRTVRLGDGRAVVAAPSFRRIADESVDHRPASAAVRVPAHRVAHGQHIEGMERQDRIQPVIIALRSVYRLGTANFLRRFAREAQSALDTVPLHRSLRREQPAKRAHPEAGMRVGMTACLIAEALARLTPGGGGLTIAGYAVIFGIHADDRPRSIGPLGTEGRGHTT